MITLENRPFFQNKILDTSHLSLDFKHKRKPTGRKIERRKAKLPNQIRHEQNMGIAEGLLIRGQGGVTYIRPRNKRP